MSALTLNNGAINSPATAANTVDTANDTATTRFTRIPISIAACGFCTQASSTLPSRVWRRTSHSASATPAPISGINSCNSVT